MTINEFARAAHNNAVAHGWWEEEKKGAEVIALCHAELSEALEEMRDGKPLIYVNHEGNVETNPIYFTKEKPEGVAVEMCDCIIRILDYLAYKGVDVEKVLELKQRYNESRPYKHGGKLF